MHPTNCLNCGQMLDDKAAYCSACGQKAAVHRISFHELWHDVVHYFTHADKGIFHLFVQLARRPGTVGKEYIAGKRSKYFKPLNFWLIVAGILVFVTSFFYKPKEGRGDKMERYAVSIQDPVKKQRMLNMAERSKKVEKITGKYSNVINMIATPLVTIFFWLFYRKKGYNYTEHLVANMYFVGFIMLFYALVFFPLKEIVSDRMSVFVLGLFFLFEIVYRGRAYNQFVGNGTIKSALKAYGISILISVFWFSLTFSLIYFYIRHGF